MELYNIVSDINDLKNIDTEGDQSFDEAIKNSLDDLEISFNDKIDNIVKLCQSLENEILVIKNEESRLAERRKSIANKVLSLKSYMLDSMAHLDLTKVNTPLFTVSSRNGRESVVIDSMTDLSIDYITTKVIDAPDKKAIAKALKYGEVLGAHLERGDNTLNIK